MSFVRRHLAVLLLAIAGSAVLPPAVAAPNGSWLLAQDRGQRERQFVPQRRDEWRDQRRDDSRQAPQYPPRLSPDERRQLRRDLHDANRDMRPRRGDSRR